jgi:outer membrane protein
MRLWNWSVPALAAVTALTLAGHLTAQQLPAPASAPPGAPPAVHRLTLDEAKELALRNNKALALAALNVEEKQHGTAAARKDYFPKVLGNVTYFHFNDDLGEVLTVERGRLGLQQPGVSTISVPIINQNATLSTVFVAQPITKLIAVNAAVQLARADETIARAKLDRGRLDLLSGVAQVYHGLLGAQRIQATLELQIRLLEQLGGDKPPPELRVSLVEARQGLLQVRGQVLELTQQLNSLLDLPPCTVLELVDPVPGEPGVRCADEAAQRALACSAEVREAEQNIAKARAALQVARMDYLPDVNVIGGYQNQSATPTIQPNFGFVGVTASYTFWEWGKRRDVKWQREATLALAQQNLHVTIEKVQLEARKTYGSFEQAREAYRLAGEMVQARKEAEKGAAGRSAVAAAKGATAKAELDLMQAEIAYRVAHAKLMGVICVE